MRYLSVPCQTSSLLYAGKIWRTGIGDPDFTEPESRSPALLDALATRSRLLAAVCLLHCLLRNSVCAEVCRCGGVLPT
jgi:hypothetical protein